MLSDKTVLEIEQRATKQMLEQFIRDLSERGGDPRASALCLLRAAYEVGAEMFGPADVGRIMSEWAAKEATADALAKAKPAGRA